MKDSEYESLEILRVVTVQTVVFCVVTPCSFVVDIGVFVKHAFIFRADMCKLGNGMVFKEEIMKLSPVCVTGNGRQEHGPLQNHTVFQHRRKWNYVLLKRLFF
jgi:hypothetical protein